MADLETPEKLKAELLVEVAGASDLAALEEVRIRALGQNGAVTQLMKTLGALPPEERKAQGQANNAVKLAVSAAIEARKGELDAAALSARLAEERVGSRLRAGEPRLDPRRSSVDAGHVFPRRPGGSARGVHPGCRTGGRRAARRGWPG